MKRVDSHTGIMIASTTNNSLIYHEVPNDEKLAHQY